MIVNETPPVADDDFPEFSSPPVHQPRHQPVAKKEAEVGGEAQAKADDVIARLRRERAERKAAGEDA